MKTKLALIFMLMGLGISENSFAEGEINLPKQIQELQVRPNNELKEIMDKKEAETRAKFNSSLLPSDTEKRAPSTSDTTSRVMKLMDEVEKLKSKVVITKENTLATQNPREKKNVGSKTFYTFREGEIYELHAGVDRVTDIQLQPGEELSSAPVSGDTVRWKISIIKSGAPEGEVTHLIVKPLEDEIETNLILTTQRRVYHLRALAGDYYMPQIAWSYPDDEAREVQFQKIKEDKTETLGIVPEKLRFNYDVKGSDYKWKPIRVFDDGSKTFIQMKPEVASSEAPALFVLEEDDEPQLVNYRVKGMYYIVDRIFDRAELRVGPNMKIELISDSYKPSFWDRIF